MTYKQRILSEIERKYNEWKLGNSAEAKYRREAYKELIELIKPIQEESVSKDLEKTAIRYARKQLANPDYPTYNDEYEIECAFEAGAKWQYEQFENNRLAACDKQTKEDDETEME